MITYCIAYLGVAAQYKVCLFFLFARVYNTQQTVHIKNIYEREVKQFVFKIPKIEIKPKCLRLLD